MRELDFLPAWYPRLRRKRMLAVAQAWAATALLVAAASWVFAEHRLARASEARLVELAAALDRTQVDLHKLDDLLALEGRWRHRDRVMIKLGLHVEATRLIEKLNEVMPPEMAVLALELETADAKADAARAIDSNDDAVASLDMPPDRQLNVRLHGVAPTDVDLASFMMRLSGVRFFENVNMSYAKDRSEGGHLMREYQITFSLNLKAPAVNK
ncbi:MAG TPA: PilN domain-containing protein [Tepidisphaeraceae bacterium]|jgi:Tfp pilus assembly protein PilN|nr:PilN domain-containing protein [Tepidisphaeraceae bacterium]